VLDNIKVLPGPPHALIRTRDQKDTVCQDRWDEHPIDKVDGLEVSDTFRQQSVCKRSNQFTNQAPLSDLFAICTDVAAQVSDPFRCRDWEQWECRLTKQEW
jgi:hypothetical protein